MTYIIDRNVAKAGVRKRSQTADKTEVGALLSICGSYGMAGAAIMSARAALRSGIGLLKIAVPASIYPIMAQAVPEAVFYPIEDYRKFDFAGRSRYCGAILIGCGLGLNDTTEKLVRKVISEAEAPVICDADALNVISRDVSILAEAKAPLILTPHDREFSRLCGLTVEEVKADREEHAFHFALENKVTLVLKGHTTIVAQPDGEVFKNDSLGNAGMACGGSGDVLAGIIASLTAQKPKPGLTVPAGVYIHAFAGDLARDRLGEISMLPTDIIDCLPEAFKALNL
jgi:NAD(P)H-hydrate epimerase